jgi:hypothetical protein
VVVDASITGTVVLGRRPLLRVERDGREHFYVWILGNWRPTPRHTVQRYFPREAAPGQSTPNGHTSEPSTRRASAHHAVPWPMPAKRAPNTPSLLARAAEEFAIAAHDYAMTAEYHAPAAVDREHAIPDRASQLGTAQSPLRWPARRLTGTSDDVTA